MIYARMSWSRLQTTVSRKTKGGLEMMIAKRWTNRRGMTRAVKMNSLQEQLTIGEYEEIKTFYKCE